MLLYGELVEQITDSYLIKCVFQMTSFLKDTDVLLHVTKLVPVDRLQQESLIDYKISYNLTLDGNTFTRQLDEELQNPRGFTGFTLNLHRKKGRYIINYFVPTGVVAFLASVSEKICNSIYIF